MAVPKSAGLAMAVTIVFWASAFAGIRAGLGSYAPGHLTLLRFVTASAVLVVYAVAVRMPLPRPRDLPWLTVSALLGIFGYHTLLNFGSVRVTAGAASLLIASVPVFTALLAALVLGERMRWIGWLGILVSFSGASLITLGEGGEFHLEVAALLVLGAALAQSIFMVHQKPYLRGYGPIRFTAHVMWIGTLMLLWFAPGLPEAMEAAPLSATAAVVYLGVFPSAIAYLTIAYALSVIPATRTASFLYVIPPLAISIAWVWLGELPGPVTFLGGGITLVGVYLVNRWGRIVERPLPSAKVLEEAGEEPPSEPRPRR